MTDEIDDGRGLTPGEIAVMRKAQNLYDLDEPRAKFAVAMAFRDAKSYYLEHGIQMPEWGKKDPRNWLYQRAEDAAAEGLPEDEALTAVKEGYSSIEADRMTREDP